LDALLWLADNVPSACENPEKPNKNAKALTQGQLTKRKDQNPTFFRTYSWDNQNTYRIQKASSLSNL